MKSKHQITGWLDMEERWSDELKTAEGKSKDGKGKEGKDKAFWQIWPHPLFLQAGCTSNSPHVAWRNCLCQGLFSILTGTFLGLDRFEW